MAKQEKTYFSASISAVCAMMETARRDFTWSTEQVSLQDQLTQDYLHKLELGDLDYGERAKLATKLMRCRQARREAKDATEVLGPLVQFLESERGKTLCNLLRETLGKTRAAEKRMEGRYYRPRVLPDSEFPQDENPAKEK